MLCVFFPQSHRSSTKCVYCNVYTDGIYQLSDTRDVFFYARDALSFSCFPLSSLRRPICPAIANAQIEPFRSAQPTNGKA